MMARSSEELVEEGGSRMYGRRMVEDYLSEETVDIWAGTDRGIDFDKI